MALAKQKAFVREYLKDFNGVQAAIRAGYSARSAGYQACTLLKNPKIKELLGKKTEKAELTADLVMSETRRIISADLAEALDDNNTLRPIKDVPLDTRRAIVGYEDHVDQNGNVSRKVKLADKIGALNLAAKLLRLVNEVPPAQGDFVINFVNVPMPVYAQAVVPKVPAQLPSGQEQE